MIIDTRNNLSTKNPLLKRDEIAYEIDKDLFKIGDGKQNYNSIGYDTPTQEFINTIHFLSQVKAGLNGKDGKDGKNGVDGKDGIDGKNGKDGVDGINGLNGKNGIDGKNGRDGFNGKDGKNGINGKDGVDGERGDKGEKGEKGYDGVDGKDGTIWLTGSTEPKNSFGKDGDWYLNLFNKNYYQKVSGKWMLLGSLDSTCSTCTSGGSKGDKGDPGIPGNSGTRTVCVSIDGGLISPLTGFKGAITVPFAGTITAWNITSNGVNPTCTFDIWKVASGTAIPTVANTITAAAKPALAVGNVIHSTTLTGWTTAVAINDIFAFNLDAVANGTLITLVIEITL